MNMDTSNCFAFFSVLRFSSLDTALAFATARLAPRSPRKDVHENDQPK
jgi:hypothetical protein